MTLPWHRLPVVALSLIPTLALAEAPVGYKITNDRFEPVVTVVSPEIAGKSENIASEQFSLRSFVAKQTKAPEHQLYVELSYNASAWRFYERAFDDQAQVHEVVSINRTVNDCSGPSWAGTRCSYTEVFGVSLSDADMIAFASHGAAFKFLAKSGDTEVVELKPSFFAGQLFALNDFVAHPYNVEASAVPAGDPGLDLYDMGHINKRLYAGVDHGLHVSKVASGSPADKAGIKGGDIVLDLDTYRLDEMPDYAAALTNFHYGQVVQVKVKQHGQVNTLTMTL